MEEKFPAAKLMVTSPTPRQILETLLPTLRLAAHYARQVQPKILALPEKSGMDNHFAEALTDADLAIQNLVEVALLAHFPEIRFFGEEWEKSGNTQFFRATTLGESGDYLVALDPIDGTRFYLDGHDNYQIILSVLNDDEFEAAIALSPAQNTYYYALRREGAFTGSLANSLTECRALQVNRQEPDTILLGWGMGVLQSFLNEHYTVIDVTTDYSNQKPIPNVNGLLSNRLGGAVIRTGNFIDGAALAFIAQEAGYRVTTHEGMPLPPLYQCSNYHRPGIVIAASDKIHRDLLTALQSAKR